MEATKFNRKDVISNLVDVDKDLANAVIENLDEYLADQLSKMNHCLIPYLGSINYNHKREIFFKDREEIIEKRNTLSTKEFQSYLYDRAIRVNNEIKAIKQSNRTRKVQVPKNITFKYVAKDVT